uniref:Uncharacterized protein n=1 Tax=Trichuris muris TaxID=70415 RepID=A0A5S6QVC7_TRIMR
MARGAKREPSPKTKDPLTANGRTCEELQRRTAAGVEGAEPALRSFARITSSSLRCSVDSNLGCTEKNVNPPANHIYFFKQTQIAGVVVGEHSEIAVLITSLLPGG